MDKSAVSGGSFEFPWLWGVSQLIITENPVYAAFLIAFGLAVKALTDGEQRGRDSSILSDESIKDESDETSSIHLDELPDVVDDENIDVERANADYPMAGKPPMASDTSKLEAPGLTVDHETEPVGDAYLVLMMSDEAIDDADKVRSQVAVSHPCSSMVTEQMKNPVMMEDAPGLDVDLKTEPVEDEAPAMMMMMMMSDEATYDADTARGQVTVSPPRSSIVTEQMGIPVIKENAPGLGVLPLSVIPDEITGDTELVTGPVTASLPPSTVRMEQMDKGRIKETVPTRQQTVPLREPCISVAHTSQQGRATYVSQKTDLPPSLSYVEDEYKGEPNGGRAKLVPDSSLPRPEESIPVIRKRKGVGKVLKRLLICYR